MTKYFRFLACLTVLVLSSGLLKAQAPYKFAYQAVVRSELNQLVRNTQVDIRITIVKNTEDGSPVYKEKQSPKTNENGLYTIVVGGSEATGVSGTIKDIEWGNGVYFIKSEVDIDRDGTYDLSTVQQLISVPYVFHANITDEGLKEILANGNSGDASHNTQIKCLANPTDNNDVVNKAYLDSILAYIDENYGGCKSADVKLNDITSVEDGCGVKLKVTTKDKPSGTVTYQWYNGDSPISGATSSSYTASNSGTYKVVATATCEGGTPATASDNKTKSVTAGGPDLTVNNIKYSGAKSGSGTTVEVDKGASLTLTADATSSAELSYEWSGAATGTDDHVSAETSNDGSKTYKVKVTATDDKGCTSSDEKSITVSVKVNCPEPTIEPRMYTGSPCNATYLCLNPLTKGSRIVVGQTITASVKKPSAYSCSNCEYSYEIWSSGQSSIGATSLTPLKEGGGYYFNNSVSFPGGPYKSGWTNGSQSEVSTQFVLSVANSSSSYYYVRFCIRNNCGNGVYSKTVCDVESTNAASEK